MKPDGDNQRGAGPFDAAATEAAYREAIEAGHTNAWANLGYLLAEQSGREREAEAAYRDAIAGGDTNAWVNLGFLLTEQPGREEEAEAACREAIGAGYTDGWVNLGNLLDKQPGREREGEAAYREAIDAGDTSAQFNLGLLLAKQPGREEEAEVAYREAIAAGATPAYAWNGLGWVLANQPGREEEAEAAYREAIAAGDSEHILQAAAANLGELLARQGDLAGARAANETFVRAVAKRMDVDLSDSTVARVARFRTAVASRPWVLRLNRLLCAPIRRLGPTLTRTWQRARRHLK